MTPPRNAQHVVTEGARLAYGVTPGGSPSVAAGGVGLGRGLGLAACSEGIERTDELRLAERLGCDRVQGFLLSAPLPVAQVDLAPLATRIRAQLRARPLVEHRAS